jgi:hypothetical protein
MTLPRIMTPPRAKKCSSHAAVPPRGVHRAGQKWSLFPAEVEAGPRDVTHMPKGPPTRHAGRRGHRAWMLL